LSELIRGNLAYPQTKIDLFDEINFSLSKEELQEAVKQTKIQRFQEQSQKLQTIQKK